VMLLQFLIGVVCVLSILGGTAAAQDSPDDVLRMLEERFADIRTVQTDFTQEKELAVFSQKVVLTGSIALENPDRLAWHVMSPMRYSLIIADGVARQWDEDSDREQHIALSKNAVLKVVTEQLQKWFTGQYASLARDYDVKVVGRNPIILTFVPRESAMMKKAVEQITVTFREDARYVHEILVEEAGGDSTRMVFEDTVLNAEIDPSMWEVNPGGS